MATEKGRVGRRQGSGCQDPGPQSGRHKGTPESMRCLGWSEGARGPRARVPSPLAAHGWGPRWGWQLAGVSCRDLPETAVPSERLMRQRKQSLHPEEGLSGPPGQVPPHCWAPISHLLGQPRPLGTSRACPLLWLPSWPGSVYCQTTRGSVSLFTPGESQVMWRTPAHLEDPAQSHWWSQHQWSQHQWSPPVVSGRPHHSVSHGLSSASHLAAGPGEGESGWAGLGAGSLSEPLGAVSVFWGGCHK